MGRGHTLSPPRLAQLQSASPLGVLMPQRREASAHCGVPQYSPQVGVLRDARVGVRGKAGEPGRLGSSFFRCVGLRGVSHMGRVVCHTTWPVGSSGGGFVVSAPRNCPLVSSRSAVAPWWELGTELGALEGAVLPRPGAVLGSASATPRPVLPQRSSCCCVEMLGGGPAVWVSCRCLGLDAKVRFSALSAAVPMPSNGAVTPAAADGTAPVGLPMSPARHSHHQSDRRLVHKKCSHAHRS